MKQFNNEDLYVVNIPISESVLNSFNNELSLYGLPNAWNFLCFKRKNFFEKTIHKVHVDTEEVNSNVHTSIVIPIEGCEDTIMYWANGKHELIYRTTENGSCYASPKWTNSAEFLGQVEISKNPCLARVDIPHGVTSRKDGSYRTILSIRLLGNPEFDYVCSKIPKLN